MKLEFSATITAADTGRRELVGQIVPFGQIGNTSAGEVVFETGSIINLDASKIKLLREHDHTAPIGRAIEFSANPAGIIGRFKVAATHAGDDILIEAAEQLRDGFSVGANIITHKVVDGVIRVSAAELIEVSVVANPAFNAARITDIAAAETAAEVTPETEMEMQQMNPETAPVEVIEVESATATEQTPVTASAPVSAPIYTSPRIAPMSTAKFVEASIRAHTGDSEAQMLVKAAADTSNNTYADLPIHLNGFVVNTFAAANRPAINACGGVEQLPAAGMSFTLARLTQAPTVAVTAENGAPSNTDLESDYLTIDVAKYMGSQTVALELLERSTPNFGDRLLIEMQKAYAKATDTAVLAALVAGGTAGSTTAGTIAGLQSFIATEVPAGYNATGGDALTELLASSAWWSELIKANDGNDRPLFSALQPSNAGGSISTSAPSGEPVFGTNFWVDHNFATSGLVDNSAILIAPESVGIWESPQTQLRLNVIDNGQVQVSLHGYMAVKVLKAGGVRRFNLT